MVFFFQAEDGIRDLYVTGVQTCALQIYNYYDVETSQVSHCPGETAIRIDFNQLGICS